MSIYYDREILSHLLQEMEETGQVKSMHLLPNLSYVRYDRIHNFIMRQIIEEIEEIDKVIEEEDK